MNRVAWWLDEELFRWRNRWLYISIWWDCRRGRHTWRINHEGEIACKFCPAVDKEPW